MLPRRLLPMFSVSLLLALAAWLLPAALRAEPAPTLLRVSAPIEARIGDTSRLSATLLSATGEPIDGATVVLYERAAFMDLGTREIQVSSAVTDASGTAVIRYLARREGTRNLSVRFGGDDGHAPASVTLDVAVAPGTATYTVESPPGIPGVNRFLVIGVLVIVWGTMLIIASHVVAIARAGHTAGGVQQREGTP